MPEGPDPLGKRALFWAPGPQVDDGHRPRRSKKGAPELGKRALFSSAAGSSASAPRRTRAPRPPRPPLDSRDVTRRVPDDASKAASKAAPKAAREASSEAASYERAASGQRHGGLLGQAPVVIECSACRERSEVSLVDFLSLHLPFWLWRPGKGYTRLMRCPSCSRRTWVSASWSSRVGR